MPEGSPKPGNFGAQIMQLVIVRSKRHLTCGEIGPKLLSYFKALEAAISPGVKCLRSNRSLQVVGPGAKLTVALDSFRRDRHCLPPSVLMAAPYKGSRGWQLHLAGFFGACRY
jgi:hypothetical protein